jgi:hypothetical protein
MKSVLDLPGFKEEYAKKTTLPTDSAERKDIPLQRGCLDYFPAALAEVARLSLAGNEKHNPGEELHHARGKSTDHADCIARHQLDRGTIDPEDDFLHDVKVAWRALAQLQEALEARGAPLARAARLPEPEVEEGDLNYPCPNLACKFPRCVTARAKMTEV